MYCLLLTQKGKDGTNQKIGPLFLIYLEISNEALHVVLEMW